MKLTAPIFRLKHKARLLSRDTGIPLNAALDRIARNEGFQSWSLLVSKVPARSLSTRLLARIVPGDLILLGARPGHGKTVLGLQLIADAAKAGRKGSFFTLEYNEDEVLRRLQSVGGTARLKSGDIHYDCSNAISADYIIARLPSPDQGELIVIDYLQLLDQKRENPPLMDQMSALKSHATSTGAIIVCISQIDRSYELSGRRIPGMSDVRLPNPLNPAIFDKACFLNGGIVRIQEINR